MRIGVLEDDAAQTELMQSWIGGAGHECYAYGTGEDFKSALQQETFDLLMLDWNLPDVTGPEVLEWVREHIDWHIPVVFITSRDHEEDIVFALENGADDYMTKPVKQFETLARLTALERRVGGGSSEAQQNFRKEPFEFDLGNRRVLIGEDQVELTHKEFELALLLFRNVGRLLSRSYILEKVWGTKADLNTRTVDTHISRVRNKLGIRPDRGWRLSAVYHHGYRLEPLQAES